MSVYPSVRNCPRVGLRKTINTICFSLPFIPFLLESLDMNPACSPTPPPPLLTNFICLGLIYKVLKLGPFIEP